MIGFHENGWTVVVRGDIKNMTETEAKRIGRYVSLNMVVVFPDQYKQTPDDQIRFTNMIGRYNSLEDLPVNKRERYSNILIRDGVARVTGALNEKGEPGLFGHVSELDWHANQASNRERKPIVWMYGDSGMEGSRTSFINMIRVYEDLPPDLKEKIRNKKCYFGYEKGRYSTSPYFHEHVNKDNLFDLVMTNSAGKTGLYYPFNQVFGMADTSHEEFLNIHEALKHFILKEKYVYHHDWKDGQIVLCDQWLSLHKRWKFDKMEDRMLHRIAFDYSNVYEKYP